MLSGNPERRRGEDQIQGLPEFTPGRHVTDTIRVRARLRLQCNAVTPEKAST